MMTPKKSRLEWQIDENVQARAGRDADTLVQRLKLTAPIDPFAVALSEHEFLRTGGDDLGNRYDGKLEYDSRRKLFLLYYNTKYDDGLPDGQHHPRTRFSISHELGHYFIEHHHNHLTSGGASHESSGEFKSSNQTEREADAFASHLLLPTDAVSPILNETELTPARIDKVARDFQTSILCTTIRAVRLSDFPCAVAGIRDGLIAWMFPSKPLIDAKCYPGKKQLESSTANDRWSKFASGSAERHEADGFLHHWFQTFDREDSLFDVQVTQSFLPVPIMGTLVVLITMNEADLSPTGDDDDDIDEDEDRNRFGRSRA